MLGGCDYGEWTQWSECTVSCGFGITRRSQQLIAPNVDCPTVNEEQKDCYLEDCCMYLDLNLIVLLS